MTLNDAIEDFHQNHSNNNDTVIELSAETQRTYDNNLWEALYVGIANLVVETQKYRENKIKFVTRINNHHEVLEIYSQGESLSDELIDKLNGRYQKGRIATEEPEIHGSEIAAFFLAKVNAEVSIENNGSPIYTLKNTVIFR